MVYREHLKQLSMWAGFVGIVTIIGGVFAAIGGFFAFIVGAIPGIIMIILGLKLRAAKRYADELLAAPEQEVAIDRLNMLFLNLNTYFKIQGILLIIYLVLALLGLLTGALASLSIMSSF